MSAYIEPYDEFIDELLHVAPIEPWMNWRYVYDQLNATAHCRVSTVSIKHGRKGLYAIVRILDCDAYLADFLREKRAFVGPAAFDSKTQMWSYWKIGQYKVPAERNGNGSQQAIAKQAIVKQAKAKQVKAKPARQPSPSPPPQITYEEASALAKTLLETIRPSSETVIKKDNLLECEEQQEEQQEEQGHSPLYDPDQPQEKLFEIVYDPAMFVAKPPVKRKIIKNPRRNTVQTA